MEEAAFLGDEMLTSVFPMLSVEGRALLCISSVLDEDNYYSAIMKNAEKLDSFLVMRVGLACEACVQEQRSTKCTHKTVRLPSWKSRERQDDVALKSLKGQNLDDVIAAIRKLADSQVRNGILGFDGIARGSRDPGFSKRGTYDPRHARG
jgi:hypothetical protein